MKKQQCCVLISSIGTIVTGAALVAVGRLVLASDVILRTLEPSFPAAVLSLGVFVFLVGLCGVVGSLLSSRLALTLYGVSLLVGAMLGLGFGGSLMFAANMHAVDIKQSCTLYQQAGQSSSDIGRQYQASYESMKQALQNCRRNGRSGALGLRDCGQLGRDSTGNWFQQDPRQDLLSWVENFSGCGGFCGSDVPLFGFPVPGGRTVDQVSKIKLRDACYATVASELQVRGSTKGAMICALSLPLFMAVCGAAWIICYPPPQSRKDYLHPSDVNDLESDRLLSRTVSRGSPENSGSDDD